MCLNCLPQFQKCLFCISLREAVAIIFIVGVLIYTPLFIISIMDGRILGLYNFPTISFSRWFTSASGLWIISSILLVISVTRRIKNEDVQDIVLQVYFWLVVAISLIHLVFCLTFLIMCWKLCIINAMMHIIAFVIHLSVNAYTVLIVNSYRMSLF